MIPKGKLLALLMVFTAVGGLAATGAFTTVEAERTADVNVDGDANALLAITPAEDPADSSFIQQSTTTNQTFEIVLSGTDETSGVNANATTTAEDIVNITNNGEEAVDVWINTEGGQQADSPHVNTTFYIDNQHRESVAESGGTQGDDTTQINDTKDPVSINERINTFDAFVDSEDIVISENVSEDSVGETPTTDEGNLAVEIEPGETVTVSMAVEIEPEANVDLTDTDDPILNNVTILAVNDQEGDNDIVEGSTTADSI
jgi:hypothetical protein